MTSPSTDRAPALEQILDTMISLTRLSSVQRVIVAGDDSMDLYLALRRLGFVRATTPAICRVPKAQHSIGLVASRNSGAGVECLLDGLSSFLAANASIALLLGVRDNSLKIRTKLQKLGFRIEAGVRCPAGLVMSACRQGYAQMARAA
jgi:hypothetical protein